MNPDIIISIEFTEAGRPIQVIAFLDSLNTFLTSLEGLPLNVVGSYNEHGIPVTEPIGAASNAELGRKH